MENYELNPVVQNPVSISEDITTASEQMFCSVRADDKEGKVIVYNALNAPTGRLAEMIGKIIRVRDVIADNAVVYNDAGIPVDTVRVILITDEGKSYTCVSVGIYNAIKKLIGVFGLPTWEDPIALEVKQLTRKGRDGQPRNVLTLAVASK